VALDGRAGDRRQRFQLFAVFNEVVLSHQSKASSKAARMLSRPSSGQRVCTGPQDSYLPLLLAPKIPVE
jgi:hypothetical protein